MADEIKPSGEADDEKISSTPQVSDEADTTDNEEQTPAAPRRNLTTAPVRKGRPTPKQSAAKNSDKKKDRTSPVKFTQQSVDELKKVNWPTRSTLSQYFVVVLVFVLFIMAFVAGLDALFGWLLLKWLG